MTSTEALGIDALFQQDITDYKAATGVIVSTEGEAATVRLFDDELVQMPVTEFYPNKRWEKGKLLVVLVYELHGQRLASTNLPELVMALLEGHVPEIREGLVRIMGVARAPGIRTKVSVAPTVEGVDAVQACVGRQASRINAVRRSLDGERFDVVPWSADPKTYISNALAPASADVVTIDKGTAVVKVPAHRMAATVGKEGLNASLAGQLAGYRITAKVS